jgi:hypothetical protein
MRFAEIANVFEALVLIVLDISYYLFLIFRKLFGRIFLYRLWPTCIWSSVTLHSTRKEIERKVWRYNYWTPFLNWMTKISSNRLIHLERNIVAINKIIFMIRRQTRLVKRFKKNGRGWLNSRQGKSRRFCPRIWIAQPIRYTLSLVQWTQNIRILFEWE